ncbi:rhodanese-like domain-containing protein [Nonlabens sp. MB-3u-79]|uniref:rhodanese-like domain-containing protein n=1 Tax=Nonlabens sp. MB-3u-79 TaxID=2058134 RepID=UPI000C315449|nr:rhodanese-like domain-containing protein [Nonlabens sp. MB-3u-79]AUC79011.1 rhodanese-like domain-containing protein [Nonlabens sp. MB-3u-79]
MKRSSFLILFLLLIGIPFWLLSQKKEAPQNDIPSLLKDYNHRSVPYLSVQMLQMEYKDYVILDTRKKEEFDVSHLPGAIWVGERYDIDKLSNIDKDTKIVVYCSVGIRSEDYGEEMVEDGFSKVYNLYGSIFSWKDAGYQVVDQNNQPTEKVHVYSKKWAKYLKTGKKVY